MIGGGQGAFIGAIHRMALRLDGLGEWVCGALSSDPEKALASGRSLLLDPDRTYAGFEEMLEQESRLPPDQRMDFVAIVTPNRAHFAPAKMALEKGFPVLIEKPMTFDTGEALQLRELVKKTGLPLCLTHTYSGYPMVKQARAMVAEGRLGPIRKIWVEYPQGWLSRLIEQEGNPQAGWRTDPQQSGKAGSMGDIGTHAAHLAEYISGCRITSVSADLNIFVKGRLLDDDGSVLLKFDNGATGVLMASQVAAGEQNGLRIRIYGERGGLDWSQMEPDTLMTRWTDAPDQLLRAGSNQPYLHEAARFHCRTPGGHPEGYIEAFANIYRAFMLTLGARLEGRKPSALETDFPGVEDGLRGMRFIDAVVDSSQKNGQWTLVPAD
jgi:predicted dehydrogenase